MARKLALFVGSLITGLLLLAGIGSFVEDDPDLPTDGLGIRAAVNCARRPDHPKCRPQPTEVLPSSPTNPTAIATVTPVSPIVTSTASATAAVIPPPATATAVAPATATPVPVSPCLGMPSYPELRPANVPYNQTRVARSPIDWRVNEWWVDPFGSYYERITGDCQGDTRQILEWAAAKWQIPTDRFLAHAVVESFWNQQAQGDWNGSAYESFGILQAKVTVWRGADPQVKQSTAFAADYFGAVLRLHYDGAGWLPVAGDWDRSSRAYYCGCDDSSGDAYLANVQKYMVERPWTRDGF